ncbi:hypothetical protein [Mycolicibacterium hippocampi]|uniref:Uncharacterized protein n=1 Tax=Mycolicibacterium hippocampi TaxID=659824 RepID=A0A7I9ZIV3_9MYCO|nr:hypothetical protein [Mycolicibacterium hippocampi]GFH00763.1 hypothetical protein MHIP_12460 [Mycolicibacterium hippocampi]
MSLTSRGRAAARQTIRVQRRVALIQALLWPALIGTALVVGATVALKVRANRGAAASAPSEPHVPSPASNPTSPSNP